MPASPEYGVTWRLHGDVLKKEFTLTVILESDLTTAEHERLHERLTREAYTVLTGYGLDPKESPLRFEWVRLEKCPVPLDAIPPEAIPNLPLAQTNPITESNG